jgi:peptide subunit release factor RF-3
LPALDDSPQAESARASTTETPVMAITAVNFFGIDSLLRLLGAFS